MVSKIFFAVFLAFVSAVCNAEIPESALVPLKKGKTTYDQVVALFGQPTKVEYNDEGLRGIRYFDQSTQLNSASTVSLLGSIASIFVPGIGGVVASAASAATGSIAGGATGKVSIITFSFDKNGLLIYYRAALTTADAGTFNSKTNTKIVTSEDGVKPLPLIAPPKGQQKTSATSQQDDRPRLGINYIPIAFLVEKQRDDFSAANFNGVIIADTAEESVAAKAGILPGDYLYILNGMFVTTIEEVAVAMSTIRKGDKIKARVRRIDPNARLYKELILPLSF